MTCDLCGANMANLSGIFTTKDVVTSQDCWELYLRIEMKAGLIDVKNLHLLKGLVGLMAMSDSPWALCYACANTAIHAGLISYSSPDEVGAKGHALCRSIGPMVFEVLDEEAMKLAERAANLAAVKILEDSKKDKIKNQWSHGKICFDFPNLDQCMGSRDGFIALKAVIDERVGEEVVLFIRDQTPFMEKLKSVAPFRFMMKNGIGKTSYGNLIFFLFWVDDPENSKKPISMWDWFVNPSEEYYADLLDKMSRQSHWHLFLVGKDNQQTNFFEFKNNYEILDVLELAKKTGVIENAESMKSAILEFQSQYTLDDMYNMGSAS